MKGRKSYLIFALLLTCFVTFHVQNSNVSAQQKTSISVNHSKRILGIGESHRRNAHTSPSSEQKNITYTSSNPKIAAVSKNGTVTALKRGTVTITASLSTHSSIKTSYQVKVIRKYKKNELFFIAHRGYSQKAPENSIPAFREAGKSGFSAAECDVYETARDKNGQRRFIIMHDPSLNRMCKISGRKIYQTNLTYGTIRSKYRIKAGHNVSKYSKNDLRIPSIEEYLSICKKYNLTPVIEIKQNLSTDAVKRLYNCIKKANVQNKAIVISRHKSALSSMRKYNSKMALQYVCDNVSKSEYNWLKKYHINLCLNKKALSSSLSSSLKTNHLTINAWTLTNQEEVSDYAGKGATAITSNMILWK